MTVKQKMFILPFNMKYKLNHVIDLNSGQENKSSLKDELAKFAKDQFAILKKKNLRLPVSIYNL